MATGVRVTFDIIVSDDWASEGVPWESQEEQALEVAQVAGNALQNHRPFADARVTFVYHNLNDLA